MSEKSLQLILYIIPHSAASDDAANNLEKLISDYEIIDAKIETKDITLEENFKCLVEDNIISVPTLVRKSPKPTVKVVGSLHDRHKTALLLEIKPTHSTDIMVKLENNWNSMAESSLQLLSTYLAMSDKQLSLSIISRLLTKIQSILDSPVAELTAQRKSRLEDAIVQLKSLRKTAEARRTEFS